MSIRTGHCTACGVAIWKTLQHPVTGAPIMLWPYPSSRYAAIAVPNGLAPGIGYCADCVPAPADRPDDAVRAALPNAVAVAHVTTAGDRYADWFTEEKGVFLRAWLAEEFKMDPAPILREWESARQEATSG